MPQLLDDVIGILNLSMHTRDCLRRAGIRTVGELAALGETGLRRIPDLDGKALAEIQAQLGSLEALGLPAPLYDDLRRHGVTTVEQLAAMAGERSGS